MPFVDVLAWLAGTLFLIACFALGYFMLATRRLAADAERRVPASGKFVTIDGNDLHFIEAGQGPSIVFLHGLGGQLHHFRKPLFEQLAGNFHVVALDRPGSGYSRRAPGASGRLKEQAAVVAKFITEQSLGRPLIVGHSLGGAVALALALDHPDVVGGLALVSPLTHLHDSVPPEFAPLFIRAPWKRALLAHTIGVPMTLKHSARTLAYVFGPQQAPKDYVVEGGGLLGLRPSHLSATIADLVAIQYDLGGYEARYEEVQQPVGVLFGTHDKVLGHEQNALPLAGRIRNFELELLDGIGHMPQFVATERVEQFVRRMAAKARYEVEATQFVRPNAVV